MGDRRSNGSGSISHRKDGRWQGSATDPDTGKRKYVYGSTREEVEAKLLGLRRELENGTHTPADRATVEEYLRHWLDEVVKHDVRPRTWDSYRATVETHLIPYIGDIKLQRLRTEHIQKFINLQIEEGELTNRTIEYQRAVLRAALNHAVATGRLKINPALAVKVPKHKPPKIEPLTSEQVRELLLYMENEEEYYRPIVTLAVLTGLRQGEILGLSWDDIDFQRNLIHVRQQLQRIDSTYQLVELKSEESKRTLPLFPLVREMLLSWRDEQREMLETYADSDRSKEVRLEYPEFEGLVFTTRYGTPINPRNMYRSFKQVLAGAGLPDIRFHDLRHTTATLLLEQGVDMKTIQAVLGHSQFSLTMNTYAHVLPSMKEDAFSKMNELLKDTEQ